MGSFAPVLAVAGLSVGLAGAVYGLSRLVSVERRPAVTAPFLAGGVAREHAMSRFHVRWYPVTMVFLAFDMEMMFMYPWILVVADMGAMAVVEMFVFLLLLLVGVVYVWREGGFRWT